jgi:hypothetical protein
MLSGKVRVSLPDASEIELSLHPWDKADVTVEMCASAIGMTDTNGMGLFEVKKDNLSYIEPDECLLDFQNTWCKEEQAEQVVQQNKSRFRGIFKSKKTEVKTEGSSEGGSNRFLFTRRVYGMPIGESRCPIMCQLIALQAARDVAMGCGAYELDTAANIAACAKVLFESTPRLGTLQTETPDQWSDTQLWDKPFPLKKIDAKKYDKAVAQKMGAHKSVTPENLLQLTRPLPLFGAQHFRVDNSEPQWPPLVILAINFYGVYLLSLATREELAHFPLMSILGWSSTPVRVLLRVKLAKKAGGKSNITCRFKTKTSRMATEICGLLYAYATEMMKAIKMKQESS